MGRSSKDKRDVYYRLAKEEGWRAAEDTRGAIPGARFERFHGLGDSMWSDSRIRSHT